jgi:hypothetical protein
MAPRRRDLAAARDGELGPEGRHRGSAAVDWDFGEVIDRLRSTMSDPAGGG